MGKRAVISVRVSDDKRKGSIREGLGVSEQIKECTEKLAVPRGYDVIGVFSDNDFSAYTGKPRPEYQKMLEFLRAGKADVVLCWHTDRLHRDNTELEEYIKVVEPHDITTETVKAGIIDLNTPIGRMVARNLCTIARYESEHRAERVAVARARQAREGQYGGGSRRPFGFEKDGVTIIPEEADAIRFMANAVLAGVSRRTITHDLRKMGILTSTGLQFMPPGIREVLLRPRNAGFMVYRPSGSKTNIYSDNEIVGKAPWEPILTEDVWRAVVAKLTDPKWKFKKTPGPAVRTLGSTLYRCPCGATVRYNRSGPRASKKPIYRCVDIGTGHVAVPAAELDELVEQVVIERLSRPDVIELIPSPSVDADVPALMAELAVHRQRLDEIAADYANDVITRSQMHTATEIRRQKITDIETKLADATQKSPLAPLVSSTDVKAAWHALTLGERRAVVQALFTVRLLPSKSGRRPNIEERVRFDPPQTTTTDV